MNGMDALSHWVVGEAVKGTYCGVAFAGKLDAYCRPTADYKNVIFSVLLDNEIIVYGETRTSIEVWTNHPANTIQPA